MKKQILILCLLFPMVTFSQLKLEDCHEKARLNYPLIKQFDLIEASRDYTISNANKAYLPQLGITAIGGMVDGFPDLGAPGSTASSSPDFKLISIVQLNQTIWDGGMTKSRKEISNADADIEVADVEVNLYKLKERVNQVYFGILLLIEQIDLLTLYSQTLDENSRRAESLYENGAAYKSDVDEIRVEKLNTDQKITELEYNKKAYTTMLSALIGEEVSLSAELTKPVLEADFIGKEINRPELKLFESQTRMVESKTRLDRTTIFPKVGLLGFGTFFQPGISFGPEELDHLLVAGLSVSWEFGSLYSRGNNKKLGEIGMDRIENQKETFLFSTNLQLVQLEKEIEKFSAMLEQDKEMIKLKSQIKTSYQSKFDNGVCTSADLLQRTNDEQAAKQNMILHEIQYMMAAYQYKNVSGN